MYKDIILLARTAISKSPGGPHWLGLSIEYILYRFSFYIPPRMNVSVIEKRRIYWEKTQRPTPQILLFLSVLIGHLGCYTRANKRHNYCPLVAMPSYSKYAPKFIKKSVPGEVLWTGTLDFLLYSKLHPFLMHQTRPINVTFSTTTVQHIQRQIFLHNHLETAFL
jgi:hypothetical protein